MPTLRTTLTATMAARLRPLAVTATLLLAFALAAACDLGGEPDPRPPTPVPVAELEIDSFAIGDGPSRLLLVGDRLLVVDADALQVFEIGADGTQSPLFDLPLQPDLVAADENTLVVLDRASGALAYISPDGVQQASAPVGTDISHIAYSAGRLWAIAADGQRLLAFDSPGAEPQVIEPLGGAGRPAVAADLLWLPLESGQRLLGVSAAGEFEVDVTTSDAPSDAYDTTGLPGPTAAFAGANRVWVACRDGLNIVAFSLNGDMLTNYGVQVTPDLVAAAPGALLIGSSTSATLEYMDLQTLQRREVTLPGAPADLTYFEGAFWAAVPTAGVVVRIMP